MLRMLLHEGLLGTVLLLGQGLVLVPEQPRQKYLLEQAERWGSGLAGGGGWVLCWA